MSLRKPTAIFLWLLLHSVSLWAVGIGDPAPTFERPALDGGKLDFSRYRGQVVYLDFWASWCGPCRVSLPAMDKLYRELSPQGFAVVAVNVDEYADEAAAFLEDHPVSYPVVRDSEQVLPERYGVKGMPTAYLIDRDGRVRLVHEGFRPGDGQRIRAAVEQLLEE